jgi:hypothetical protein
VIWLAVRQLRTQALVVLGVLAVVAMALAVTGPHLVHLYNTTVRGCATHGDCPTVTSQFLLQDRFLQDLNPVVLVAPALIGIFWGAPLVARELETGTHRLAWTQGVSRSRWILTKLVVVGLASVVVVGLLSLMVTWWSSPFDRIAGNAFSPALFDRRDIVPGGYAAFAFALGAAAGVLIRRTLPAMAVTLVAFVGVRFAVFEWVRPRLTTPLEVTAPFNAQPGVILGPAGYAAGRLNPADWVLSEQTLDKAGRVIGQNGGIGPNGAIGFGVSGNGTLTMQGVGTCPNSLHVSSLGADGGSRLGLSSPSATRAFQECADKLGIREVLSYQPLNRYWPFQIYETAIFIALALILGVFCFWWVRRRLT